MAGCLLLASSRLSRWGGFDPELLCRGLASREEHLVLYSFSDRSLFDPVDNLKAAIRSRVNSPVKFYVHYLEEQGLEDANYDHSLSENLRGGLRDVKLDVVIAAVYSSYQLRAHRDELFPGVPVIFSYVNGSRVDGKQLPPGVTGVTVSVEDSRDLRTRFQAASRDRESRGGRGKVGI